MQMLESITTLTEYSKRVETSPLFLAYFTAPGCGVCTSIRPKIEGLLAAHPSIESCIIDISTQQKISAQLSVFSIPAVLFYAQGKETIREARYFSVEQLEEKIERYQTLLEE